MCCRLRGRVKRYLHDYAGALVDLDAADRIEPNDLDVLRYVHVRREAADLATNQAAEGLPSA